MDNYCDILLKIQVLILKAKYKLVAFTIVDSSFTTAIGITLNEIVTNF